MLKLELSDSEAIMPCKKAPRSRTTESLVALDGAISKNNTVLAIEAGTAEYSAQVIKALTTPNNTSTPGAAASG